jgi:hypothetical protein
MPASGWQEAGVIFKKPGASAKFYYKQALFKALNKKRRNTQAVKTTSHLNKEMGPL